MKYILGLIDYGVNRRQGHTHNGMAEMFECCRLREGSCWPQIGDAHRFFKRQAGRHDFPKQARHLFIRQRPRVVLFYPAQYLSFPLGAIKEHILTRVSRNFDMGHFLSARCPRTDQGHDFFIQTIDLVPQLAKTGFLITHITPSPLQTRPYNRSAHQHPPLASRCKGLLACRQRNDVLSDSTSDAHQHPSGTLSSDSHRQG